MTTKKKLKAFRLTPEGDALLQKLRDRLGLSGTAVLELAIRRLAEVEGVWDGGRKPAENREKEL